MLYKSTGRSGNLVTLKEAILDPLPLDGGLYLPQHIPKNFLPSHWQLLNFIELCTELARPFLCQYFTEVQIKNIVEKSMIFDTHIYKLNEKISFLELWHGPTHAFKDFGARFLAQLLSHFIEDETHILVATSGDTGAAVASGLWKIQGITVHILYPKGKISDYQEKQITHLGENIKTYSIEGNFDDCQNIVKQSFKDEQITQKLSLTSANSINIGRLIPQIFYYFRGLAQMNPKNLIDVIIPSGNFGNLTAGIIAKMMGAPIGEITAATNANNTIYRYFQSHVFNPQPTIQTLSTAMDVSMPSNFERIWGLLGRNVVDVKNYIQCKTISDDHCMKAITELLDQYNYLIDPHTSVGYLSANFLSDNPQLILSTAHPCKFKETMEKIVPKHKLVTKVEHTAHTPAKSLSNKFNDFKQCILDFS